MRNELRIVTRWQVPAPIEAVAALLTEAERFPDWWGEVYLSTEILDPGGEGQVGRRVSVRSKGWLPYHIRWTGTLTESDFPRRWRIRAEGDLNGEGEWRLSEARGMTEAVYDWRVTADRPLLRVLSPLLGPVFAWNHRWAMERGRQGLLRELRRDPASPG